LIDLSNRAPYRRAIAQRIAKPNARSLGGRYLRPAALIAASFLLAFIVDQATGQQHSNLLGSAAILATVVIVWPWPRTILFAAAGYIGVWIAFALGRAGAAQIHLALIDRNAVGNLEHSLFGGHLPSATMQDALYHPGKTSFYDLAALAIHASFFVVPTAVALLLLATNRPQFTRYWTAAALMLALASFGFLFAPTAPPWLAEPGAVTRVIVDRTAGSAVSLTGSDPAGRSLSFDPNSLAALPSVHVAAAVLVSFAAWQHRRRLIGYLGLAYALAMSISVIYLGEHYALDAVGGWAVAVLGWWPASRLTNAAQSVTSNLPPRKPIHVSDAPVSLITKAESASAPAQRTS
jgi:membrane-associated phospholipid phosphatase